MMNQRTCVTKKPANIRSQRVKLEECYVPSLEDEGFRVQNLLAEPKLDHLPVEDAFCFGMLDSNGTQGQDGLEFGMLDGFLDGVDEVDDIYAANDISGACEDFLLDDELVEKVAFLDGASCDGTRMSNLTLESQSPGSSGGSNGALLLSESSTVTVTESDCLNVYREKRVNCELNDSSREKRGLQVLKDYGTELDGDMKPLESSIASDEHEKKAVQLTRGVALTREKRIHKPTRRYIEESSNYKSKQALENGKVWSVASEDKLPMIICQNENNQVGALKWSDNNTEAESEDIEELSNLKLKHMVRRKKFLCAALKDMQLKKGSRDGPGRRKKHAAAPREHSIGIGNNSEAAPESRPWQGRPKKNEPSPILNSDDEHSSSESEEVCVKRKRSKKKDDRRKHQRMWTLTEVMKLIDGIARYGTGRWTDIKKLLFSSSAYRTPVDLRDKWRNLLRASSAQKQKQSKKEVEQKLKHAMRPLPKAVLRRISELASLHPYPRFTPGGRYTRSKN